MSKDEKIIELSVDEAMSLCKFYIDNKTKMVHTFLDAPGMLLGAGWSYKSIKEAMKAAKSIQIGGEQCMNMGHGIVIIRHTETPVFVEHKEDLMKKYL